MKDCSELPNAKCWRCRCEVQSKASILCPSCHAVEVAKVHEHDTPDQPDVSLGKPYEPPVSRVWHDSGRRVIRKSTTMS